MPLLEVAGVDAFQGRIQVLWQVSLRVEPGEIVSVVGSNGAGKSTLIDTISGLATRTAGTITFAGRTIDLVPPHERVALGLVQIPEGRRLFPFMSVVANLRMGSFNGRARARQRENLERVFGLFPVLRSRMHQVAGTLSGGEQQMLTIGRALMAEPTMLMIDEPSLGLAPLFVKTMFEVVQSIRAQGVTVLLVEQNVRKALTMSDRAYVLENGRIVLEGAGPALLEDHHLRQAYLGL
jgi:branched-chain amino acid transport system ATP-binding protein